MAAINVNPLLGGAGVGLYKGCKGTKAQRHKGAKVKISKVPLLGGEGVGLT